MTKGRVELTILTPLCYVSMAVAIVCAAFAPYLLTRFGYQSAYAAPLWLIALAFAFAVWQLRGILKLVASGDPFSRRNEKYLRRISWCCFAVAVAALAMLPIYFSLIKVLMALFAIAGGLVMRVLARVFLLAAQQKEEMDLII